MATNAVTREQDAIALEVQIAAPPEQVFQAITDPTSSCVGGDSGGSTTAPDGVVICVPAVNGAPKASAKRMEAPITSAENIWRSIPRVCWSTPGLQVGPALSRQSCAGSLNPPLAEL